MNQKCSDDQCDERHCHCRRHMAWGDYLCPTCVGSIRADMRAAEDACVMLPEEAEHRGVNSEAAYLAGPHADPTRWQWRRINQMRAGVDVDGWDMLHPGVCFGQWERELREDFGHDDVVLASATMSASRGYLDTIVAVMARSEDHVLVLAEMGDSFRRLRRHLEGVLRDGEQVDTGAPCMSCNVPLRRVWGDGADTDGWICPRCKQTSSEEQYQFAVQHLHRAEATHLTDRDMEIRTGVKAGTVRSWARKGYVTKTQDSGRTVYSVAEVKTRGIKAGLIDPEQASA